MAMNQNPMTKSKDVCLVTLIEFIFSLSCVRNIYHENIPIMKFNSYFMRKFTELNITNNIRQIMNIIGYTHRTSRQSTNAYLCVLNFDVVISNSRDGRWHNLFNPYIHTINILCFSHILYVVYLMYLLHRFLNIFFWFCYSNTSTFPSEHMAIIFWSTSCNLFPTLTLFVITYCWSYWSIYFISIDVKQLFTFILQIRKNTNFSHLY